MGEYPYRCGRRNKVCRSCERRYSKDEHALLNCPDCGFSRLCQQFVRVEGEACRKHGGASKKGKAHHGYKHGIKSKYDHLPIEVRRRLEKVLSSGDLMSCEHEIRMFLARAIELEERLNTGEHVGLWKVLDKQRKELQAVRRRCATTNDPDVLCGLKAQSDALTDALLETIKTGASTDKVWDDYRDNSKHLAELRAAEERIRASMRASVAIEEVARLLSEIVDTLNRRITDETLLATLAADIGKLYTLRAPSSRVIDARIE